MLAPSREFAVIAGRDLHELRRALLAIHERFRPHKVVAPAPGGATADGLAELIPLLKDRPARGEQVTTYVCENFTCLAPVTGVQRLREALGIGR